MSSRLPGPQRRRQLLAVATEVFGSVGYHDASMSRIAEAAGVTKPVLYQHFESKTELYREVVADVGRQIRTAIAKATAAADTPRDQVARGMNAYAQFIRSHSAGFRALFSDVSRSDPMLAAEVRAVEGAMADQIAELILILDMDEAERQVLAHALVGMAETASLYWDAAGRPVSAERLTQLLTQLAWAGLRGERPPDGEDFTRG